MKIIRDGKKVWPYCDECKCRLSITDNYEASYAISHFGIHPDKDARGCRCSRLFNAWLIPKYRLDYLGV